MLDFVILFTKYFILIIFLSPLYTFIHEIGHAVIWLYTTKHKVVIVIGGTKNKGLKIKIKRLTILFSGIIPFFGYCDSENIISEVKKKQILIYIGGPLFSIILSFVVLLLAFKTNNNLLFTILMAIHYGALSQFIFTILPIKYSYKYHNGRLSDGFHILRLLKTK